MERHILYGMIQVWPNLSSYHPGKTVHRGVNVNLLAVYSYIWITHGHSLVKISDIKGLFELKPEASFFFLNKFLNLARPIDFSHPCCDRKIIIEEIASRIVRQRNHTITKIFS